MEKKTFLDKIRDFIKKNYHYISFGLAIVAIAFLFLPVLKFEIRESVYDIVSGERVSKTDYLYDMTLISYFSTGYKLNFTMFVTIGFILSGGILVLLGKKRNDLITIGAIMFLLAVCMIILSTEFFKSG